MSATAEVEDAIVEEGPKKQEAEKEPAKEKKTASHPPSMIKFRNTLGLQLKEEAAAEAAARHQLFEVRASPLLIEAESKKPAKKHPTEKPGKKESMEQRAMASGTSSRLYVPGKKKNEKTKPEMVDVFGCRARGKLIKIKGPSKLSKARKKVIVGAKKMGMKQPSEKPRQRERIERMKRRPMIDAYSSSEAEEEAILEKDLKPYVNVPWKKKNEKPTPEDEEYVMNDLLGYGPLTRFVNEKREWEEGEEEEVFKMNEKQVETWRRYTWQIIESQGFDFKVLPGSLKPKISAPIRPYFDIKDNKWLNDLCCKALAEFNSLNRTRFEFVKVEKANTRICNGRVVFVTFQAWKPHSDSCITFQARVYRNYCEPKKSRVHFCRIEKDARGPMDSKLDQGTKSDVEAQYEAAAAGPSESHSSTTRHL